MAVSDCESSTVVSGNSNWTYQYVKKTGYLVKSPTKFGRWRKRWCKLVDMVMPDPLTNMPTREVRLEYYVRSPKKNDEYSPESYQKMKGIIVQLRD